MNKITLIFVALALAISVSEPAYSADKKDKATLRKIQQIKQQMEAEKADLQAKFDQEKAALDSKVSEYEKQTSEIKDGYSREKARASRASSELAKLQNEHLELNKKSEGLQKSLTETQAALDKTKADLNTLEAKYTVATTDLKANDTQRKNITKALTDRENMLMSCTEKNSKLHAFGLELVKIYDKPTAYEAVLRTEPFAQLKRVELETILQSYRDKLDDQKFDPSAPVSAESQAVLPNQ